ncbi:phosphatase PAP2 family protein [Alteromonas sp. H39]|uniref:phosphatase PAP2 family protein n=1 Tax=Alteromonas sp. H39 TaxID=3389876 RepID=UPI0039E075BF
MLSRTDLSLKHIILLGVFCGLAWLFIELAIVISTTETVQLDRNILLLLREPGDVTNPIGPTWLEEMMRDVTALGSNWILFFLVLIATVYLKLVNQSRLAILLVTAIVTGFIVAFSLKHGIDRPRPDLVSHGTMVYTASFPSAHAMMSTLVYFTLAALLSQSQARRRVKLLLYICAGFLALWVGSSRVYLGVHWPSDVIAGWCAGGFWALLFYYLATRLSLKEKL